MQSKLFSGDQKLEACLVQDAAHITLGATGPHVSKIHTALLTLDNYSVAAQELRTMTYGHSTANAVLAYKRKRRIINYSYQHQADNIVGKMTIAAMDREMRVKEGMPSMPRADSFGTL